MPRPKGFKHTEGSKRKMSETHKRLRKNGKILHCLICKKMFYVCKYETEHGRKYCSLVCSHIAKKGTVCSKETKIKMSKTKKGKYTGCDSHNWIKERPKCLDCKKELKSFDHKRCIECSIKNQRENPTWQGKKHSKETKNKISTKAKIRFKNPKNHPKWKGGIRHHEGGYILVHFPNHPFSSKAGYVKRSRLVMEEMISRYLATKEVVHHKGIHFSIHSIENKQDDTPENLQLFANNADHIKIHIKKIIKEKT